MLAALGVVASVLQAAGYVIYIRKTLRHEVAPNPTTWLMFAYGTALLTLLEWDRHAPWSLLILPFTCAVMSLVVAGICWRRGDLRWPESRIDRCALTADIALTVGYAAVWLASNHAYIGSGLRDEFVLLFLALSNASTLVAFIPILRETYHAPRREHGLPWLVWCAAYSMLAYATYRDAGAWSELLVYPLSNALLHGAVGWLAMRASMSIPITRGRYPRG